MNKYDPLTNSITFYFATISVVHFQVVWHGMAYIMACISYLCFVSLFLLLAHIITNHTHHSFLYLIFILLLYLFLLLSSLPPPTHI